MEETSFSEQFWNFGADSIFSSCSITATVLCSGLKVDKYSGSHEMSLVVDQAGQVVAAASATQFAEHDGVHLGHQQSSILASQFQLQVCCKYNISRSLRETDHQVMWLRPVT